MAKKSITDLIENSNHQGINGQEDFENSIFSLVSDLALDVFNHRAMTHGVLNEVMMYIQNVNIFIASKIQYWTYNHIKVKYNLDLKEPVINLLHHFYEYRYDADSMEVDFYDNGRLIYTYCSNWVKKHHPSKDKIVEYALKKVASDGCYGKNPTFDRRYDVTEKTILKSLYINESDFMSLQPFNKMAHRAGEMMNLDPSNYWFELSIEVTRDCPRYKFAKLISHKR